MQHSTAWPTQDAKAHFSTVIKSAVSQGPQIITRHGVEEAVILSIAAYRKLTSLQPNFAEFLLAGPKLSDDFVDQLAERDQDTGRPIDL